MIYFIKGLRQEVGDDFERPPGRSFRLFVNGEITSAHNFSDIYGSKMFIHYFLELPMGWSQASDEEIHGITQTSYLKQENDVAHFGQPFNLDLYYDTSR